MSTLTAQDIINHIAQVGSIDVQFKAKIEDYETFAEAGMRGRIVSAIASVDDLQLLVDFGVFDEHNRPLAKPTYFDAKGNPTRTAYEAGFYQPQERMYLELNEDLTPYLEILSGERAALFNDYQGDTQKGDLSYVQWLEDHVFAARKNHQ